MRCDKFRGSTFKGERAEVCTLSFPGDNIIENNICEAAETFRQQQRGAHIILKEVDDAERFGCPEILNGRIVRIDEKPKQPKSRYAVTGIYMYDQRVFEKIKH